MSAPRRGAPAKRGLPAAARTRVPAVQPPAAATRNLAALHPAAATLLLAVALTLPAGALHAQDLDRACWSVTEPPPDPPGRVIRFEGYEPEAYRAAVSPGERRVLDALDPLEELFLNLPVVRRPPGTEVAYGRNVQMAYGDPPEPNRYWGDLSLGFFHPTKKKAVETTTWISVRMNVPGVVTHMLGSLDLRYEGRDLVLEPLLVGELAGARIYGYPESNPAFRECFVVFKANEAPLWEPVSREEFLQARLQEARASYQAWLREMEESRIDPDTVLSNYVRDMEETIREMRRIDPGAAAEMERQMEQAKADLARSLAMVDTMRPEELRKGRAINEERIAAIEAELAALGPAGRTARAYVGGRGASRLTGLAASPDSLGAWPLAVVNPDYLDPTLPPDRIQILVVELRNRADHPPEPYIMSQVRREVDWNAVWEIIRRSRSR